MVCVSVSCLGREGLRIINMVDTSSPGSMWEDESMLISQERKQSLGEITWPVHRHTVMSNSPSWDSNQVCSYILFLQLSWCLIQSHSQSVERKQITPKCEGSKPKYSSAYYCERQPTLKRHCLYHFFQWKEDIWWVHPFLLSSIISVRTCGLQLCCFPVGEGMGRTAQASRTSRGCAGGRLPGNRRRTLVGLGAIPSRLPAACRLKTLQPQGRVMSFIMPEGGM